MPSAAHLRVSLILCSSRSNTQGELRALEGSRVSSKSPSRVRDRDKGVAGRNRREKYFPYEGSLIYPPGKSMIFYKKGNKKIELVAKPYLVSNFKWIVYVSNLVSNLSEKYWC